VVAGGSSALVRRNKLVPWHKLGASAVPEGYELSCEEACRVRVDLDNSVTMAPGAVISVGGIFHAPLSSLRDRLVATREVTLLEGKVEAASAGTRGLPLVVTANGSSHVGLRGAEAQIVLKGDHVAAQVTSGSARAGANRKWVSLEQGQMTILPAQGGPSDPVVGLTAPEWTSGTGCSAGLALESGDAPAALGGCWKPIARASSYVVELSRDAAFSKVESTDRIAAPAWSKSLADGRYFVRVRAVDDDGLVGADSPTRKLGAIVAKAPPGSVVDAPRSFTLPQGRSLEIADPSGLETALDGGSFAPAQKFIVMDGAPSHVLHLRFKDDPGSAGSSVLQRRALAADVVFTPKLARWPQDSIDITVTISDASHVVDPAQVSPKMHVLVGVAEIPLDWSHAGRVWSARLPPRAGAPTVVRVIAEDEFGTPIGRNFVEVDQGGPYVANK
jgi:hypothetical protein